jgi:hypothetical protein
MCTKVWDLFSRFSVLFLFYEFLGIGKKSDIVIQRRDISILYKADKKYKKKSVIDFC